MIAFFVNRLLASAVVIVGVLTLVFFTLHLIPGDAVEMMLGEQAASADKAALRQQLGLDLPIHLQYQNYLGKLLQGDLGYSIHRRTAISSFLPERIANTAILAGSSLLLAVVLALPLGVWAALHAGKWQDALALQLSLSGISIPNFVLGPILILIFSLWLQLLPTGGSDQRGSLILPTIALGTAMMAVLSRMTRASLTEVMGKAYILAARARGASLPTVVIRHALPNALLPVITITGLQLGTLLGGAVITEIVFSWPGVGSLLLQAIESRDYPLVQACIMVVALAYVVVNLLTDLLYARLDPRIRIR